MHEGKTELKDILEKLNPKKNPGIYVYTRLDDNLSIPLEEVLFCFRENEGNTYVLKKEKADIFKLSYHQLFSWITLDVHTSLNAVGLTSTISNALSRHGIPCNMVAAYTHDHLFVPDHLSENALQILHDLTK